MLDRSRWEECTELRIIPGCSNNNKSEAKTEIKKESASTKSTCLVANRDKERISKRWLLYTGGMAEEHGQLIKTHPDNDGDG